MRVHRGTDGTDTAGCEEYHAAWEGGHVDDGKKLGRSGEGDGKERLCGEVNSSELWGTVDIDRVLIQSVMSKETYFIENDGASNNQLAALIPALLQKQGVDPTTLLAMMGGGGFGGGMGGFGGLFGLLILFLFLSGGFGGFGFGGGFGGFGRGGFVPNQINNDANTGIILQALERNGVNINNLATALGTSKDAIMTAINGLSREICNFSNQTGMQTNQIITALLQGNNALTSQIAGCCCDLKGLIAQLGCNIEKTIMSEGSNTRAEIAAARNDIKEGQRAAEMREMQREIDALRESKSDLKTKLALKEQNDFVQATLNAGLQPVYGALQKLQSDIDGVKCKMPPTVPVQWPQLKAYNPDAAAAAAWAAQQYNNDCGC